MKELISVNFKAGSCQMCFLLYGGTTRINIVQHGNLPQMMNHWPIAGTVKAVATCQAQETESQNALFKARPVA